MSDSPDTTAAFESEADEVNEERTAKLDKRREELKAQLAQVESEAQGELVLDDEDDETLVPEEIEVDGRTWHFFPPTEGQVTVFAMASSGSKSVTGQMRLRRLNGFLQNLLTDDDYELAMYLAESRDEDFTFEDLMEIVTKMIERASGANKEPANRAERRALAKK